MFEIGSLAMQYGLRFYQLPKITNKSSYSEKKELLITLHPAFTTIKKYDHDKESKFKAGRVRCRRSECTSTIVTIRNDDYELTQNENEVLDPRYCRRVFRLRALGRKVSSFRIVFCFVFVWEPSWNLTWKFSSEDIKRREPWFVFTLPKTMLSGQNETACVTVHEASLPVRVQVDLKIKDRHHLVSHTLESGEENCDLPERAF